MVWGMDQRFLKFFLWVAVQLSQHHFFVKTLLFPQNFIYIFVKNQLSICVGNYFCTLTVTLIKLSLCNILHYSDCCSFIMSLEIRQCQFSKFIHFQRCFVLIGPFPFYMNLEWIFHFLQNIWYCVWDIINICRSLRKKWYLSSFESFDILIWYICSFI